MPRKLTVSCFNPDVEPVWWLVVIGIVLFALYRVLYQQ